MSVEHLAVESEHVTDENWVVWRVDQMVVELELLTAGRLVSRKVVLTAATKEG